MARIGAGLWDWLSRGAHGALWLGFPVLKAFAPSVRRQPCLWRSRLLRGMLPPRLRARSRINYCLNFGRSGVDGHCWLTVNGREVSNKSCRPRRPLVRIGGHGGSEYWVVSRGAAFKQNHATGES